MYDESWDIIFCLTSVQTPDIDFYCNKNIYPLSIILYYVGMGNIFYYKKK